MIADNMSPTISDIREPGFSDPIIVDIVCLTLLFLQFSIDKSLY